MMRPASDTGSHRTPAGPGPRTLYQRVLGDSFDTLPDVLRSFHSLPDGGSARGIVEVTCGRGLVCRGLATLMRLPAPCDAVELDLNVIVDDRGEWWRRTFGKTRTDTYQFFRGGLLVEAAGRFSLGFRVNASAEGLRFERVRAWLWGIPLPSWLAPCVTGIVTADGEAWHLRVQIELPPIGTLACYQGKVAPR